MGMAVVFSDPGDASSDDDLLPWLRSITQALADFNSGSVSVSHLNRLVLDCISTFKDNLQYRDDPRFFKLWFIYLDTCDDFESAYREMDDDKSWPTNSLFYELYAFILEAKGMLHEAAKVYQIGILRNAEGVRLKKVQAAFLERMSHIISATSPKVCESKPQTETEDDMQLGKTYVNPWSTSTLEDLLKKINSQLTKYDGYHFSTKAYSGKVALSSLRNSSRNKVIEIGGRKYQIKGCAGQGGFAQVFKAHIDGNPDEVVALKVQKPAFPWEFYMYRQLDQRILDSQRYAFGFAQRMHVYSDYSILICDYLSHGTLQDAINSYLVTGKTMEEVLCIYYTIEMLRMLETLHAVGIIHGDFKADNLLIRYARDNLSIEGFEDYSGSWRDQGLCLVDWGRGIDLHVFPEDTEFKGDCRTSSFRCIEMLEDKPWKYQADTYGLCVVVHMMLHGTYMKVEKKVSADGSLTYQPKSTLKRYWNADLWKNLFTKLLNINPDNYDKCLLQSIRQSFEDYMISNKQLIKNLKDLLARQRSSLCSA